MARTPIYPAAPNSAKAMAVARMAGGIKKKEEPMAEAGGMETYYVSATDYPEVAGKKVGDVVTLPMKVVSVDGDNYGLEYAMEEAVPVETPEMATASLPAV